MRITIEFDSRRARNVVRVAAAGLVACLAAYPVYVLASQVGTLTSFSPGTPIRAADFNANFTALSTAINDADTKLAALTAQVNALPAGPQGPQGVQGPAGPNRFFVAANTTSGAGGGTNAWTPGAAIVGLFNGQEFARSQVEGKPYSAVVRIITSDATTTVVGNALAPGALTLDVTWRYAGGHSGAVPEFVDIVQPLGTITIAAGLNDVTQTFTGTVPTPGNTANGYPPVMLISVGVSVNAATVAQGQSANFLFMTIGP